MAGGVLAAMAVATSDGSAHDPLLRFEPPTFVPEAPAGTELATAVAAAAAADVAVVTGTARGVETVCGSGRGVVGSVPDMGCLKALTGVLVAAAGAAAVALPAAGVDDERVRELRGVSAGLAGTLSAALHKKLLAQNTREVVVE